MKIKTFIYLILIVAIYCMAFPMKWSFGQTATTGNILPPINQFSYSGTADGQGNTGAGSGGTYTFTVPLSGFLTKDQINAGFTLNYSVTVFSDYSNIYVPTCGGLPRGWDCKDLITITMTITDGGLKVAQWSNTYTLDYGGYRNYAFSNAIPSNNFSNPAATLSLYGVDAGYCCGMYGPKFSDPVLSLTYNIIEQVVSNLNNTTTSVAQNVSNPANPISPTSPLNQTTQPSGSTDQSPQQLSPIAPMSPMAQQQQQQQGQQINVNIDRPGGGDTATVTVSSPERGSETFTVQVPAGPGQQQGGGQMADTKSNIQAAGSKQAATSIANKVLEAIKDSYDSSAQGTKVALMSIIASEYKDTNIPDMSNWYSEKEIYENKEMVDPYSRVFNLAQDKKMNQLIESQYGVK